VKVCCSVLGRVCWRVVAASGQAGAPDQQVGVIRIELAWSSRATAARSLLCEQGGDVHQVVGEHCGAR
jgi:hypothetical protein